jgi:hypothetical protein
MTDQDWIEQQVAAWWSSLRIPANRRWMIHEMDMGRWARAIVGREARDAVAHSANELAIQAQAERPGDPLTVFRSSMRTFLETLDMAKKAKATAKKSTEVLDVPVKFKSFGYGGGRTCRLGVNIDGKSITDKMASHFLGGAQLAVELTLDPNAGGDVKGQDKLLNDTPDPVTATVDVKGFSYADKCFSAGLTFPYEDVEAAELLALAGKTGKLVAERTGDATERRGRPSKGSNGDGMEGGEDEE